MARYLRLEKVFRNGVEQGKFTGAQAKGPLRLAPPARKRLLPKLKKYARLTDADIVAEKQVHVVEQAEQYAMEAFEAPPEADLLYAVYAAGHTAVVCISLAATRDHMDKHGGDGYQLFKMVEM